MKKLAFILCVMCLLTGCSAEVYETLGAVEHVSATLPQPRQTVLHLPADAALLTSCASNTMYTCGDWSITVQQLSGGDLQATVQTLSGFAMEKLTVMETVCGDHKRYDFVWTAAGENGDLLCRAAVIDDGSYHYCLTAMAEDTAASAAREQWNALFNAFCLAV